MGRYDYDVNLQRVRRRTATENLEYVIDSGFVLQELDASLAGSPTKRRYHYGKGPLAVSDVQREVASDGTGAAVTTTRFLGTDGLGSVSDATSASGEVVAARKYDAWGNHRGGTAPGPTDFKLGYTGHQFDTETGLTYARARYYDSELGRFISRDSYEGQLGDAPSLHRYAYAHGNPLRFTDVSGYAVNEGSEYTGLVGNVWAGDLDDAPDEYLREFLLTHDPTFSVRHDDGSSDYSEIISGASREWLISQACQTLECQTSSYALEVARRKASEWAGRAGAFWSSRPAVRATREAYDDTVTSIKDTAGDIGAEMGDRMNIVYRNRRDGPGMRFSVDATRAGRAMGREVAGDAAGGVVLTLEDYAKGYLLGQLVHLLSPKARRALQEQLESGGTPMFSNPPLLGLRTARNAERLGIELSELPESVLFRIRKGKFGTPRNPRAPTLKEFNPRVYEVRAGELEARISERLHPTNAIQRGGISGMSNDDLARFRVDDPISASGAKDGLSLTGGHHRTEEIIRRVNAGEMDPDTVVRVLLHD